MADKKRYQIFVSSTFADLKEERQMVMQAILERKSFPAGMELFPAKDKRQFDYIKKVIDDSDYYLLIIGARYGSLDDDGISFTEKEYDYAVSKNIPVIAFLHRDINTIPIGKADLDNEKRKKLDAFKAKVQKGRLVNYWEDPHELKSNVISSLVDAFEDKDEPRIGWVRADSVVSGDAQKEINRLKKEIVSRQDEINSLETKLKAKDADLTQKDKDINALISKYQAAQQEIELLNKQIKDLKSKLEKSKTLSVMSNPETETFTVKGVSFKMVHVQGGTFMMGADDKNAYSEEKPAHFVTLSDFWIAETQVTQELWQAVMGNNPSQFKGNPIHPVESVSWLDCKEFIRRLIKLTGKNFHLPTEAQWEFAARGGNKSKGFIFAGNNDIDEVAWYIDNSENNTHPVGQKDPNELGLYDMTGNVWEWCNDIFDNYGSQAQTNPNGPAYAIKPISRVYRGGGWLAYDRYCRISYRFGFSEMKALNDLGLRLAL